LAAGPNRVGGGIADSAPRTNCGDQFLAMAEGNRWSVKLFGGRQSWHYLSRFRFFLTTFRQFETIDLLYHFVGVNWPSATTFLDKLADNSPELFFFSIINHNGKTIT